MKSFKQFLNEETMPYAGTAKGIVDIENSSVRDGLNSQLAGVTTGKFVTPYIALERVSKALANFHIFIPRHSFLEGDSGMFVWPINQFGIKFGQQNDGTFVQDGEVLKDTSKGIHPEGEDNKVVSEPNKNAEKPLSVIFEYRQSDCGMFNIFCEVITQEELDEILSDLEDEMNDDEEEDLNEGTVDEACWEGYRKDGMKKMFGKMYPNCVKADEEHQLDETSAEKKKEYADKAISSKAGADFETGKNRNPFSPEYKKATNTSRKRDAGLRRLIRSTVKEEKFTNRVPSANPYGNLDAAKKEMNKPKPVPTRNTKDLDHMNRDDDDNTVVEGNKENKEKKKEALIKSSGKKNLRDVRAQMKDRVNRDFDPRALKVMEEEENLEEVSSEFIRKKYLPKARPQLAQAKSALLSSKNLQTQDKLMKFIKKRGRGVSRAENKLTKGVMSQFNQNIKDTFSPEKVAKLFAAQKASQKAEMKDKKEK